MRTILTLAAATLALVSTAATAQPGERRFTHAGTTYVYSTVEDKGRTVISGRQMPSGDTFRLVVDGERVTGDAGGQPVAFRTSTARGAAGGGELAAN